MKNNRIKGIIGLMDITKRFNWDSRHEFPVNTLDSFIFDKEYAERMSSVIFEEIENHKFNTEFHTKVEMGEIKEISSDIIRQAVFEEKLKSKTHTLVKKIVPVQAGSKIEFMFRAKGLCSAVMENLHAVVTMNLKTEEQAINLQEWLLSQEKWFRRKENCVQFKLDAISNVSGARDNVVSRLLSGAYEMYGTLDSKTFSFTREEVKNMNIKNTTLSLLLLVSVQLFSQESFENNSSNKFETKLSYLDSIKKSFVNNDLAARVDSLWMNELVNLDLYNTISDDIKNINIDEEIENLDEKLREELKKISEEYMKM